MHNDVVFPDFSASDTNRAGRAGAGAPAAGTAAEAGTGQLVGGTGCQGYPPGARASRLDTPPFSWLGGDAWPDFPG